MLALGHKPEWPGTAGPQQGPSDPGPRQPGELVDTKGLRTRPQPPGTAGRPCAPLDASVSGPGQLVHPSGPWSRARVGRDIWLTHGSSGTAPSHLCDLVDPEGPRNWARVAKDIGSTSRALEPERESPGTAFRPLGPSDRSASRQGELVDTGCPRSKGEFPETAVRLHRT